MIEYLKLIGAYAVIMASPLMICWIIKEGNRLLEDWMRGRK